MSQTSRLTIPPPLSLYIHIPWCVKKCPYCDFNSHEHKETQNFNDMESIYVKPLLKILNTLYLKFGAEKFIQFFLAAARQVFLAEKQSTKF